MRGDMVERRRYPRVSCSPRAEGGLPGRPLLINTSLGGLCLWLSDLAALDRSLTARVRWDREERVLPLRPVWLRPSEAAPDSDNLQANDGWLMGFAFGPAPHDAQSKTVLQEVLLNPQVDVDLLGRTDPATSPDGKLLGGQGLFLTDDAIAQFKTAAESLVPILNRHFTEVRLVLTRDRLEIAAPFRSLAESNGLEVPRQARRAIPASQARDLPSALSAPQGAPGVQPTGPWLFAGYRWAWVAAAGILALVVAWTALPFLSRGERPSTATTVSLPQRAAPIWAADVDAASRDRWMEIQTRFGLSDPTMLSAIRMLKENDWYPPAHMLRDLTAYPPQVERAFGILAGSAAGSPPELGTLVRDLEARLVAGAGFPDEPPGARHSLLDREMNDNNVVRAILDLLRRRRADPAVKDILSQLRRRE